MGFSMDDMPRRVFANFEWWTPIVDVYLAAKPEAKDPRQSVKKIMHSMRKEGVQIPVQYLGCKCRDGQIQPYACTNKSGAQTLWSRLAVDRRRTSKAPMSSLIMTSWQKTVEEKAKEGKVRSEIRDGVPYYAVSDVIEVVRTHIVKNSAPSEGVYLARREGRDDETGFYPWKGKQLYLRDRGPKGKAGMTYCVDALNLPAFFNSIWHMRVIPRRQVKQRSMA